ncbi:MAG: type II and III secretion system protein [Xenococcaceae cyanobacterium MO_167.B27]|nr:type II and III secretion system protein [Xenococcaceae cyanobacterium MO_167.B27]
MTLSGDFIDEEQGLGEDYPSAFGITFTPVVSGIALAVVGVVGAGYIFMNMVTPAQESYSSIEKQKQEKITQLNQVKGNDYPQKIADLKAQLEAEQALKLRVIAMFTNQDDLETLLIDFSNFIATNKGTLVRYSPDSSATTIDDGSLGENVNGKLKRKGISVQFEATFAQTQKILQNIERLQPLLMIKSYESKVTKKPTVILTSNRRNILQTKEAVLTTNLKIDAILPLSQQELEQAKKADNQAKTEAK